MRRFMFVLVMLAAITSCATNKPQISKSAPPAPPPAAVSPVPAEPAEVSPQTGAVPRGPGPGAVADRKPNKRVDVPPISVPGPVNGAQPRQGRAARGPGEQPYQVQVENMPIGEFINLVFGKVLDASYSADKSIEARKETVTLNMKLPARQNEILEIVGEVLKSYGFGITQKEGVFFVGPVVGQPSKPVIPYFVGSVPETVGSSEVVGLFLQPSYLKPSDFAGIAGNLALSAQGRIQQVPGSSIVSVIDDANHARAAAELLGALDRPALSNKKMRLFYLNYLPVDTFLGYLNQALPAQGIPVAKTPAENGLLLVPLKQIRAVLAVSLKHEWFDQIGFWQEKLDLRSVSEDEPQFFVFHPKNRRASDLAKLFGGGGAPPRKGSQTGQQDSGTRQETGPETMGMQPQRTSPEGEKSPKQSLGLSDVTVVVDENTNSLVFTATRYQYSRVEDILNKLDLLPRQVLIEVTIGEVSLVGQFQYGIEWAVKHTGDPSGTLGTLGKLSLSTGSGFVYSLMGAAGNFQMVLNAFAQDNVLKVISTPTLVVLDNQEANINVGDQVPILTSQVNAGVQTSGNTSLLSTIQYQKTGVILHIKPTINSQGMLTLLLRQEVSNATANTTSTISSPVITTREIETSVALKSGSSVLLGGLMTNQVNTIVNKVPGLGDIPLINPLFRTTSRNTKRTELFVQITPHILSTAGEAEDATKKYKELLDLCR